MDLRSLALFRFFIGLVVVGDLLDRSKNLEAHYTDYGIWSRSSALEGEGEYDWVNVYMLGGSFWFVSLCFCVHALIALSFSVGYKTWRSNFLLWIFTNSIDQRNQHIGHGGDMLLGVLLFWCLFLPMGKCWSIDRVNSQSYSRSKRNRNSFFSLEGCCLILQICFVYIFSYFLKNDPAWRSDYSATFLAISLDYFRMKLGDILLSFPVLLRFLTWAVAKWEVYGPFFYISPFFQPHLRIIGIIAFIGMHVGFGTVLRVGGFFWIGLGAHLILIPTLFWEKLFSSLEKKFDSRQLRIYYNTNCSSCQFKAKITHTFFLLPSTRLFTHSEEIDPSISGIYVEDEQGKSFGFKAFLKLSQYSPILYFWTGIFRKAVFSKLLIFIWVRFLSPFCDRHNFEIKKEEYEDSLETHVNMVNQKKKNSKIRQIIKRIFKISKMILSVFFILYILSWNIMTVDDQHPYALPSNWRRLGIGLYINQAWGMFAPKPPSINWWYVYEAELENGTTVDFFRNRGIYTWEPSPLDWEKPDINKCIGNHRWWKFFESYNDHPNHAALRLSYGRWLCREWNKRKNVHQHLFKFNVWWLSEWNHLDGTHSFHEKLLLWEHMC